MQNFIVSTLKQREQFYRTEFDLNKVRGWFKKNKLRFPQLFAVDMGSETGIIKNKEKKNKMINLRPDNLKEKLIRYLPEDVYYDRNIYKDPGMMLKKLNFRNVVNTNNFLGQQLAFDVDAENMKCKCKFINNGHFCEETLIKSVDNAVSLAEYLKKRFDNVGLVYSGRGMHVHVFDKAAFNLLVTEREDLNRKVKKFGIDPWVSRGYIRLMRLPHSLNALVSRKVIPLTLSEAKKFNPITSNKIKPKFLYSASSSFL